MSHSSEAGPVGMALSWLAQGDAERAADMLRNVLDTNPADADAWHAMACVARAGGDAKAAAGLAGQAIQLRPEAHFHITLGLALLALGHYEEARAAVNVAVAECPRDPRAHLAMAEVLEAQNRTDHAEQALRNALRLRPLEAEYHSGLAAFLARQGKVAEAVAVSEKAVLLTPDDIFSQNQHALLLEKAGRIDEACPYFSAVAKALPDNAAALSNYGVALFETSRFDEARQLLSDSARLKPDASRTRSNLGLVHMALGDLPQAVSELHYALALEPDDARLAVNLGTALADSGEADKAESLFRAVAGNQAAPDADRVRARFNLSTLLLADGRFHEGWALFENRKLIAPSGGHQGLPEWHGQQQAQPVLLYAEQGLGDTLQFMRYIDAAAERAPVILSVPQSLYSFFNAACFTQRQRMTFLNAESCGAKCGAVAACSLLSLPYVLGQDEPVPCQLSFSVPSVREGGVQTDPANVTIGLCWAGNPAYRFDRRRSLNPVCLAPFGEVAGVCYQSLQRDGISSPTFPLRPLPGGDMLQTAALIATLEGVVTADTAIAHLAGLMGKPTWLLNRFGGDWRWAEGSCMRSSSGEVVSRWYPSVRVMTQPAPGEGLQPWAEPVAQVVRALSQFVEKRA